MLDSYHGTIVTDHVYRLGTKTGILWYSQQRELIGHIGHFNYIIVTISIKHALQYHFYHCIACIGILG